MKKFYYTFAIFTLVFLFGSKDTIAFEYKQRYILEDRKIKSVCLLAPKYKNKKVADDILNIFFNFLSSNNSKILFFKNDCNSRDYDAVINTDLKEYSSQIKTNTISDSLSYDVLEQQVKISIEIKIKDKKTDDLIWKRNASKYQSQSWLNFSRSRIADNKIASFFSVPSQLATSIKRQYNEKELIDKTINDVIKDLSINLVNLK
ncbi:MAG: hypothetical protein H7263_18165 [Candidatus Sericytochromatia bacterium]|nr:hypothetical protein [Candidatus Sericytochromatia bacterium]